MDLAHFWRDMRCAQNMYDESNKYFKDGDGGSLMKVFLESWFCMKNSANIFIKADIVGYDLASHHP